MPEHDLVGLLRDAVEGEVRADEPLADHTTLKVGGPALAWVRAEGADDLAAISAVCHEHGVPWLVVGRGSNLLVADAGWPGVVVSLGRAFRGVDIDGETVVAGAAEPMPVLARTVGAAGLAGFAFGVAIPGVLGGAVRMNAGAHGAQIADVIVWADVAHLADSGRVRRWSRDELGLSYRHSALPGDAVVVRARLDLHAASADRIAADMEEMRAWRRAHQPIGVPSCGSTFKNPPGDAAGRLIESAGCKGVAVGGARISDQHANFITVTPGARADDVHEVLRTVQARVAEIHGVHLEPEVVIVGYPDHRGQT